LLIWLYAEFLNTSVKLKLGVEQRGSRFSDGGKRQAELGTVPMYQRQELTSERAGRQGAKARTARAHKCRYKFGSQLIVSVAVTIGRQWFLPGPSSSVAGVLSGWASSYRP
jgi:hypothetical protein